MDIRSLQYFLAVIRLGTVGAAAEAHFVTQPAVSAQLKRLEAEVGERLFERRGRSLVPTAAGRLLAAHAEDVVRRMDALGAAMRGLRGLETGTLRVGNIDAASVYVLPEVYRQFHDRYPGITVEIVVGDSRHLLEALRRGDVELATMTLPVDEPGLVVRRIYREDLVPVAHTGHPLARARRVTLEELSSAGLITYPADATSRRLLEQVFESHGAALRSRMEISSPEAIRALTEAGLGVSILPRPVVAGALGRTLAALRLPREVRFRREIGIVLHDTETLSPAARAFLELVERAFR